MWNLCSSIYLKFHVRNLKILEKVIVFLSILAIFPKKITRTCYWNLITKPALKILF